MPKKDSGAGTEDDNLMSTLVLLKFECNVLIDRKSKKSQVIEGPSDTTLPLYVLFP